MHDTNQVLLPGHGHGRSADGAPHGMSGLDGSGVPLILNSTSADMFANCRVICTSRATNVRQPGIFGMAGTMLTLSRSKNTDG